MLDAHLRLDRRQLLKFASLSAVACNASAGLTPARGDEPPADDARTDSAAVVADVRIIAPFHEPVMIKSIDAVRIGRRNVVRVTSESGRLGIAVDDGRLLDVMSLFKRRAAPFFQGKDARQIVRLVDDVYGVNSNYKLAGMPFWCAVAHVELAVIDLLGKIAGQPAGSLFGRVLRTEIPVYLTRLARDTTAEREVAIAAEQLAQCGAKACKLKIGGRMKNESRDVARTNAMVPLARKSLGESIAIYVDANGSYSVREAIEVGKMLEAHRVGFFEEPCPWEDHEATKRVADALTMMVAGGEQDSSWHRWHWMATHRAVDLLQPDLYYNGGIIRCLRLARLAQRLGLPITPHSPATGPNALPMLHFASITENAGPHQEYAFSPEIRQGKVALPKAPGMGINLDDSDIRCAEAL